MSKKRILPRLLDLSALTEMPFSLRPDLDEVYQLHLQNEALEITERVIFMGALIEKCSFQLGPDGSLEFSDCVFNRCDLSNLDLSKTGFYRCEFRNCKLLGTNFTNSFLQDVGFVENLANYANFSGSRLKTVDFEENELAEASFSNCQFQAVTFFKNQLDRSNFWETKLAGLDLSSNSFDSLEITPNLAKKLKISLAQAPFFLSLLGIEIK